MGATFSPFNQEKAVASATAFIISVDKIVYCDQQFSIRDLIYQLMNTSQIIEILVFHPAFPPVLLPPSYHKKHDITRQVFHGFCSSCASAEICGMICAGWAENANVTKSLYFQKIQ